MMLYVNSTFCGFVFDDLPAVVNNKDLQDNSSWSNLMWNDFWGTPMRLVSFGICNNYYSTYRDSKRSSYSEFMFCRRKVTNPIVPWQFSLSASIEWSLAHPLGRTMLSMPCFMPLLQYCIWLHASLFASNVQDTQHIREQITPAFRRRPSRKKIHPENCSQAFIKSNIICGKMLPTLLVFCLQFTLFIARL